MKTILTAFGISLLASINFVACTDQEAGGDEDNLPGDIDNAPDINGDQSKADAWNADNDPAALSTHLVYRLTNLPKTGKLDKPVWKKRFPRPLAALPPRGPTPTGQPLSARTTIVGKATR